MIPEKKWQFLKAAPVFLQTLNQNQLKEKQNTPDEKCHSEKEAAQPFVNLTEELLVAVISPLVFLAVSNSRKLKKPMMILWNQYIQTIVAKSPGYF